MTTLTNRNQILDLLIDMEINPKSYLKVSFNLKREVEQEFMTKTVYNIVESFLLNKITREEYNEDLRIVNLNVYNKFN